MDNGTETRAKEKPWQFKKGQSGNPGGKFKDEAGKPCRLLRDFRFVYEHDSSRDRTPGQKMLRKLYDKNPDKFITQMTRLETAHKAGKELKENNSRGGEAERGKDGSEWVVCSYCEGTGREAVLHDEGSQRVMDLCEELLGKFRAEQAEEDAKLAARPDAAEIGGTLQKALAGALEREARLLEKLKELEGNGAGNCPP